MKPVHVKLTMLLQGMEIARALMRLSIQQEHLSVLPLLVMEPIILAQKTQG